MGIADQEKSAATPFDPFFEEIRRIVREEVKTAIGELASLSSNGEDRLLTVGEAAPVLGYTKDWLYHHWKQFPFARKIGRKGLRFSYQGIQKFIAARRT